MHGRVYRFEHQKDTKVQVCMAFLGCVDIANQLNTGRQISVVAAIDMSEHDLSGIRQGDSLGRKILQICRKQPMCIIRSSCALARSWWSTSPPPPLPPFRLVLTSFFFRCVFFNLLRKVFASFGGLLMRLTGDQRHVANIEVDSRVFCLLRRNA